VGEVAVAGRFVLHGAGMSADGRIREIRREIRHTAVLFLEVCRVVVTQTVVEREFAGDLPGILRIESELVLADAAAGAGLDVAVVTRPRRKLAYGNPMVLPPT